MMTKALRILRFLRLTDEDDNLSLSNLTLIFAVIYMAFHSDTSMTDVAALFGAIGGYQIKRFIKPAQNTQDVTEVKEAVERLETSVTALQMGSQYDR